MKEEELEQGLEGGWDGLGSAEGKWESPLFYCHYSTFLVLDVISGVLGPSFNSYPTLFFHVKRDRRPKVGRICHMQHKKHFHLKSDEDIIFH